MISSHSNNISASTHEKELKKDYTMPILIPCPVEYEEFHEGEGCSLIELKEGVVAFIASPTTINIAEIGNNGFFKIKLILAIPCNKGYAVTQLVKSPTGEHLATLEQYKEPGDGKKRSIVRIWEWRNESFEQKNKVTFRHLMYRHEFAITENAKILIFRRDLKFIYFNIRKQRIIHEEEGQYVLVAANNKIIIVSYENQIKIRDGETAFLLQTFPLGKLCHGGLHNIHVLPGNKLVVISDKNKSEVISVFDLENFVSIAQINYPYSTIRRSLSAISLPNNKMAIACDSEFRASFGDSRFSLLIFDLLSQELIFGINPSCFNKKIVQNIYAQKDGDIIVLSLATTLGKNTFSRTPLRFHDEQTLALANLNKTSYFTLQNEKGSALHFAVKYCCLEVVKRFVEGGADLEAKDNTGETILACSIPQEIQCPDPALWDAWVQLAEFLIKKGANFAGEITLEADKLKMFGKSVVSGILPVLLAYGAGINLKITTLNDEFIVPAILKNCLFLGAIFNGNPVTRETPGFEETITNLEELKQALLTGEINCIHTRNILLPFLARYPDDKMLSAAVRMVENQVSLKYRGAFFVADHKLELDTLPQEVTVEVKKIRSPNPAIAH